MRITVTTEWPFVSYTFLKMTHYSGGWIFQLDHRGYAPIGTDFDINLQAGAEVHD